MVIFSFRSRTQSMKYFDLLRGENIPCKIMNTPREVSVGCGLSVMVGEEALLNAQKIFAYMTFDSFLGMFSITGNSVKRMDTRR